MRNKQLIILEQMISSGANFFLAILIVKKSGLESFGMYSLYLLICFTVTSFLISFVVSPFQIHIYSYSNKVKLQYKFFIAMVLMATLIFSAVVIFFIDMFMLGSQWHYKSFFIVFIPFSFALYDCLKRIGFSLESVYPYIIITAIIYFIMVSSLFFNVLDDAFDIITLHFYLFLIGSSASFYINFHQVSFPKKKRIFCFIKRHINFSKWLMFSSVLQWFSTNYVQLKLASLLGLSSLGVYRMLLNIVGLFNVIYSAIEGFFPIELKKIQLINGDRKAVFVTKMYMFSGFLVLLTISVFLLAIYEYVFFFLYSIEVYQYKNLFLLMLFVSVLYYLNMILRVFNRVFESTQNIFVSHFVMAVISVLFVDYLLKVYSVYGLVMLQIIGLIFSIPILLRKKRERNIN